MVYSAMNIPHILFVLILTRRFCHLNVKVWIYIPKRSNQDDVSMTLCGNMRCLLIIVVYYGFNNKVLLFSMCRFVVMKELVCYYDRIRTQKMCIYLSLEFTWVFSVQCPYTHINYNSVRAVSQVFTFLRFPGGKHRLYQFSRFARTV